LRRDHVAAAALGLFLFTPVASALELGAAYMRSGLGQTLVVEIPYRLAANEQLAPSCISLVPASRASNPLPTYTRANRISISATHIQIFGDSRVLDPLIGLDVSVRCPTAPHFVRSYELFVDPPSRLPTALADAPRVAVRAPNAAASSADAPAAVTAEAAPRPPTTSRSELSPRARGEDGGAVVQGQTYRVVRGDTLSGIAARVASRPTTIRATADAIFAANPGAFTRGNRDLLEAGRSITIPVLAPQAAEPIAAPAAVPTPAVSEAAPPAPVTAAIPTPTEPSSAAEPARVTEATSTATVEPAPAPTAVAEPAALAPTAAVSASSSHEPAAEPSGGAQSTRTSPWLTVLLALGAIIVLSVPAGFMLRRRRQQARSEVAVEERARKPQPRRALDPAAGIEVVESRADRTLELESASGAAAKTAATPDAVAPSAAKNFEVHVNPADPVDLDVGVPVTIEERVNWFPSHAPPATNDAAVADATAEQDTVTARMASLDAADSAAQTKAAPSSRRSTTTSTRSRSWSSTCYVRTTKRSTR
jgi:phage tail protein X